MVLEVYIEGPFGCTLIPHTQLPIAHKKPIFGSELGWPVKLLVSVVYVQKVEESSSYPVQELDLSSASMWLISVVTLERDLWIIMRDFMVVVGGGGGGGGGGKPAISHIET